MKLIETELKDLYIIEPKFIADSRGWFEESWSKRDMEEAGLFYDFVQDNHSYSKEKGTLRGLHFQRGDAAQAKLVRCVRGEILDVVVDLRKSSPSYKKWISVVLSEENKRELMVPRGFAHGFVTLSEDVEFLYRVDNYYNPGAEAGIRYNDPELNIDWGIDNPILSQKDAVAPYLSDYGVLFE